MIHAAYAVPMSTEEAPMIFVRASTMRSTSDRLGVAVRSIARS